MRRKNSRSLIAMQFDLLSLTPTGRAGGRFGDLYAVEGMPGVYRRVPKKDAPAGHFSADFGEAEVCLVRADDVEGELAEAGFSRAPASTDDLPPEGKRAVLDGLFADKEDAQAEVAATE